jgi:hypothetical protein
MGRLRNEIAHGTMMNVDSKEMRIIPYTTTIPFREGISINDVQKRTRLFVELVLGIKVSDHKARDDN